MRRCMPPTLAQDRKAVARPRIHGPHGIHGSRLSRLHRAATGGPASNVGDTVSQADAHTDAAAFWKTKTRPGAIQWTEDAKLASDAIAAAAARADWDTVKTAVPKLQQICTSCHGVYRERLDDGTYRFKAPAK